MGSRTTRLLPIGILGAAFVVRLAFLIQTKDLPLYYHPILDSSFFHQWADFKLQFGWLAASPPFREPLYAYVLGLIYTVFRESLTIARLVQCVIGSFTALLVYSMARRIYGTFTGIAGGLIFVFCGSAIFFTAELNEATVAVFLLVLSAYFLVKADGSRPYLNSGLSGLFLGIGFLARFTMLAALPAWIIHLLLSKQGRLKGATLILVVFMLIPPVCYQTLVVRGDERAWFPLRSGWHAFLGSGLSGGTVKVPVHEITVDAPEGSHKALAFADHIEGQRDAVRFARIELDRKVSGVEAGTYWRQKAAADLAARPARFLGTYLTKLGILMGTSEPPANVDQRFIARYSVLLRTQVFTFGVIAPMGLVGLFIAARRKSLYAATFIPAFALFASAYLVSDSEKILLIPFLSIFAGRLIETVISSLRNLNTARAVTYVAAAAAVGILLWLPPKRGLDEARELVLLGEVYGEENLFEKAEDAYKQAMALAPDAPEAYVSLARLYGNSGKTQAGIDVLKRATSQGVEDPRVLIEEASLLITAERQEEAVRILRDVETSYPYEPRLHQLIGIGFMASGQTDKAAEELERELEYSGPGFITLSALGRAELELGDYEDAAEHLEAALALNPYNTPVAMQLADAYTRLGYHIKACDVLSMVLTVDPGNMPLRFKFANCLYRAGRYEDALSHFRDLHKFDPANADILLNMGTVYAQMDSLDRAVEVWERALVLDPQNEMARQNLRTARE